MIEGNKQIDHLFRHQSGKMVSVFTRIFGLHNLQTIEDAVQDTFIQAAKVWPKSPPDNPEGWLTTAAKNRILDLFRKTNSERDRHLKIDFGATAIPIQELFLEGEIEDSQLRMIFTACNPLLDSRDQISFALKTVSGFSTKEIASALLTKEETIKKRLSRARRAISDNQIKFEIPTGNDLNERRGRALSVIYLIFNEGFHSTNKNQLIRKDLCAEAARLVKLISNHPLAGHPSAHAVHALFCFHSARLDTKIDENGDVVSLKDQDRSCWNKELIFLGNASMHEAMKTDKFSVFHYEAAIASEHVIAASFEATNWKNILHCYERLNALKPSSMNSLSIATVYLQMKEFDRARRILDSLNPKELEQREYLFYGLKSEYLFLKGERTAAVEELDKAIGLTRNEHEKKYLLTKKATFIASK